ncbi:MAG: multicopper oxidase domain-containing protein, partial [Brevundimonas sp.]
TDPTTRPVPGEGAARRTWHLRANAVVLLYVAAALVALVARDALPVPRWLAVHLLLLGAATNAIVTWSEHFAVALLHARAPSRARSGARLVVLNAAVLGVLVGFCFEQRAVVIASAVLLAGVVIGHLVSLVLLSRRALMARFARTIHFYLAAGLALLVGVTLGSIMAVTGERGVWYDRLHAAHVHANVLGWVALSVLGTLFTLWPTVLRTRIADGAMTTARRCLWLTGGGLAVVVGGFLADLRWVTIAGLVVYGAGVAVALQPFVSTARRKRPTEFAAVSMAAGTAWLAVAVALDMVALAGASDLHRYLTGLDALVPVLAVGFVLQVLIGSLTYLVPVLRGGGPAAVRTTIAALAPAWRTRVIALNLGVAVAATSTGLHLPRLVVMGGWGLIGAAVLGFLALVVLAFVPERARGPVGGLWIGVVMTALPLALALSGQGGTHGPSSVVLTGTDEVQTVQVRLVGMNIEPSVIEVAPGTQLKLVVTNDDAMRHDLAFPDGPSTPLLSRGEHAELDLGTVDAALSGWCTVPGHRAAGMTIDIRVTGADAQGTDHDGMDHDGMGSMPGMSSTSSDVDVHDKPGSGWQPRDARLAPASAATVHRVRLPIVEKVVEVAPGVRQRIWTFGGTAPGPTLRGKVGDEFEVTLVNEGTTAHGIDFHAGQGAPDEQMRSIEPGQSLVYRFTADHSGAWLYHCSTMPMGLHIANGMFGAVVIDPPGLPAVDREYVLVSSELFLGSKDEGADAAKVADDDWDASVFNGYPDQYVHAPLTAKVGERVRWWVVAAGPNDGVDFHIVGTQFDTVFKEGAYLLRPGNAEHGAAQVLDLEAAQGGFVEQAFTEPGHYALVDHDMRRGESGARGVVEVTR